MCIRVRASLIAIDFLLISIFNQEYSEQDARNTFGSATAGMVIFFKQAGRLFYGFTFFVLRGLCAGCCWRGLLRRGVGRLLILLLPRRRLSAALI